MRRARPKLDRSEVESKGRVTLHQAMRAERGPLPFRRAVSLALDLAEDLAEVEARGAMPPGPLTPDCVLVDDDRALAVLEAPKSEGSLAPIWCPPAQADGAPFDHAANRYVLGLLLYRMLTGSHPFGGAGLRRALDAARAEAPPFKAEVAEALPPGLQALTLRMLHPNESKRPSSGEHLADALSRFHLELPGIQPSVLAPVLDEQPTLPSAGTTPRRREAESGKGRPSEVGRRGSAAGWAAAWAAGWVRGLLPLGIGAAVVVASMSTLEPPAAEKTASASVGDAQVMGPDDMTAADCATCHARQASEWRRSVMGHAVKSPLFNALESLVQEQIGRDNDCPNGAGVLRKTSPELACRDRQSGLATSGSGGEHWCVNCHAPTEVQDADMPAWNGRGGGDPRAIFPVRDLLGDRAMEGISCGFCHQVQGPVNPRSRAGVSQYQGNPTWTSFLTGRVFEARPEDRTGVFGIANSGFDMNSSSFLLGSREEEEGPGGSSLVHKRPDASQERYLRSSEFCGSCHDVRLFGTDVLGGQKGEHFKRLRNGFTEWREWAAVEKRQGRTAASCQDCHMSAFPGVCEPDAESEGDRYCPEGTRWSKRAPGVYPEGRVASGSEGLESITTHYLTGVDLPLSREYPKELLDEGALDVAGIPVSAKARRDALIRAAFDFDIGEARLRADRIEIPIEIENVGAGHRVPAGFSQEREIWVHLEVKDSTGRVVYEVGRIDRDDEDLRDKVFERVNTDPSSVDGFGRPIGLFGADVRDGADKPRWSPPPERGGSRFVGEGLINFQNGFLRCVTCIGTIAADGTCQPLPGQERRRADRFADGVYDLDTGSCTSNLQGQNALFETYFPAGALDASRGILKAPDAIIDTRSLPPNVRMIYTYDLDLDRNAKGPFEIRARLLFRAFPPYLIRAFAEYERAMARLGRRPSGPLVDASMLERIDVVEVAKRSRSTGVK